MIIINWTEGEKIEVRRLPSCYPFSRLLLFVLCRYQPLSAATAISMALKLSPLPRLLSPFREMKEEEDL